jgi:tRNA nucleotidyltransferase (CCA-adding enzyme)
MNYIGKFPQNKQIEIKKIANLLRPYTNRAYLVGGCVRDMFLNIAIQDLDIEIYDINTKEFDSLMIKNDAIGVGKSFFVYKLDDIDLALPRVERKVGAGHKAFEVEITDDEKVASKRRDFSMNAMMINIFDGKLKDYWLGQESLKCKKISLIDEKSFKEDSLRVLRAIQFAARFGFEIEDKTLDIMKHISLEDLSKPRILWEFEKLFNAEFLEQGFVYMYRLNIFEKIFTCKPNKALIKSVENELKKSKEGFIQELRPYYFFYIVANILGFDALDWLKKLEAPNHYLRVFKNQPFFFEEISDRELALIAMDMPIKKWLGNYKRDIKQRAKKLALWDKVYSGGIDIQDVIKDGFTKENIKLEYTKRVKEKLEKEFSI